MTSPRPLKTSPAKYALARTKALAKLWECGLKGEPVTYGDLAELVGMDRHAGNFWKVLDDLSRESFEQGGPLISVLVVNAKERLPSGRFYTLARKLGFEFESDEMFAEKQAAATLEWIASHPPYD